MAVFNLPFLRLYGPGWVISWSARYSNIWRMTYDMEGHHCAESGCGTIKRSCFEQLHLAYCCVPIQMANGQWRFCGNRFGVESPHGCSLHHYGEYEDNRFFQMAKKNLEYKLPSTFPHEQIGWQMNILKLGDIRFSFTMCMGLINGQPSFVRVLKVSPDGSPAEICEIVKVAERGLQLTKPDASNDSSLGDNSAEANAIPRKPAALFSIIEEEETNEEAYNNATSYMTYNQAIMEASQQRQRDAKDSHKARAAEKAAKAASSKSKAKLQKSKTVKETLAATKKKN